MHAKKVPMHEACACIADIYTDNQSQYILACPGRRPANCIFDA